MSDLERIQNALKKAALPKWVARTSVEAMTDHSGEPAVRVTIVVKTGKEGIVKDGSAVSAVAQQIRSAVRAAGVRMFAYTRFVGASELAA